MWAGSEYARGWWAGIRVCQGVVGRYQSTLGGGGQGSEYVRQVGIRVHWAGIRRVSWGPHVSTGGKIPIGLGI